MASQAVASAQGSPAAAVADIAPVQQASGQPGIRGRGRLSVPSDHLSASRLSQPPPARASSALGATESFSGAYRRALGAALCRFDAEHDHRISSTITNLPATRPKGLLSALSSGRKRAEVEGPLDCEGGVPVIDVDSAKFGRTLLAYVSRSADSPPPMSWDVVQALARLPSVPIKGALASDVNKRDSALLDGKLDWDSCDRLVKRAESEALSVVVPPAAAALTASPAAAAAAMTLPPPAANLKSLAAVAAAPSVSKYQSRGSSAVAGHKRRRKQPAFDAGSSGTLAEASAFTADAAAPVDSADSKDSPDAVRAAVARVVQQDCVAHLGVVRILTRRSLAGCECWRISPWYSTGPRYRRHSRITSAWRTEEQEPGRVDHRGA
jgi:hypothetical protein